MDDFINWIPINKGILTDLRVSLPLKVRERSPVSVHKSNKTLGVSDREDEVVIGGGNEL